MAKIGLVPMAAKPYHAGHDGLVRIAASECDRVMVFVSLSDRDEVKGEAMGGVWKNLIEPTLPDNVSVSYGGSPVRKVWEVVGGASQKGSKDTYAIYSDPEDIAQNYPRERLEKYAGTLYAGGGIILRAVQRSETVNVSGTQMRQWLATGDKASFVKHLPKRVNGDEVWRRLGGKPTSEGLLRELVRLVLRS